MVKDNSNIEMNGTIIKSAHGIFKVKLDNEAETMVECRLSGKLRLNKIKLIDGDKVKVSISPYDLTHGIITWRL